MVSITLIIVISVLLAAMTNATVATWRSTTGRVEQFRAADNAFESITRHLSQATLNTYWDYFDASGNPRNSANTSFVPNKYGRMSELRFISGYMTLGTKKLVATGTLRRPTHGVFFQAPLGFVDDTASFGGLDNLLNTWGYYVEFRDDAPSRPAFITSSTIPLQYRYRLMEMMQPSNTLSIYNFTAQPNYVAKDWFTNSLPSASVATASPNHVLAENVIALVLQPKLSKTDEATTGKTLSTDYFYDSTATNSDPDINPRNQLPPIVQVTLVAIDETSAGRIANSSTPPAFDAILNTLFLDASKFAKDLDTLQTTLAGSLPPIRYRVFTTNVSIRAAKWSRK